MAEKPIYHIEVLPGPKPLIPAATVAPASNVVRREIALRRVPPPPPPPQIYTVIIQVIDISTRAPIPNAIVTIDGRTGRTGSSGQVSFNLPRGTYTVSASATGYYPATETIVVP